MANKWGRRIVVGGAVMAALAGLYVVAERNARNSARAELERQMHARFEQLQCDGPVEGDVCLAHPGEGRCLTGEYIDYRTVWGYPQSEREARAKIRENYEKMGDPQKFVNWLACQGFSSPLYHEKYERNKNNKFVYFSIKYVDGFSAWDVENVPYPFQYINGARENSISIYFNRNSEIEVVGMSSQRRSN